ncbi:bifunctional diguanylate cyclase/phosphodiesterase [Novosphingobium sp.]|uniref:putative bifunctional diguanylate cyclase/phosphodiesterase n=1 Tax=Novosphingobium sp. TaxID=1874826 RepID=UPI00286E22A3|nr:bifunctional diguanylate cyclase/phosphodiesterase [Novosphingobium sp.]
MAVVTRLFVPIRNLTGLHPALRSLLLIAVGALVTFSFALYGSFMRATDVADWEVRRREQATVETQIDRAVQALTETMKIQLTWDDAFRATGRAGVPIDQGWADSYFGDFLWANLQIEQLYLVSPEGKMLRAWNRGLPAKGDEFSALAPKVRAALNIMNTNARVIGDPVRFRPLPDAQWPIAADGKPLTRWSGALDDVGGRTAIVTTASIIPDTDYAMLKRRPNALVAVRSLDPAYLRHVGEGLLLEDFGLQRQQPGSGNAIELHSPTGQSLGWLAWKPNDVGAIISDRTMPLLIAYLAFYILILGAGTVIVRQALRMARESAQREAEAKQDAMLDPMLGLPNRRLMMRHIDEQLARVSDGDAVFLAYIDLDHFKAINEAMGHPAGDAVLIAAVANLKAELMPGDVLARLASDEFVIVHRGPAGIEEAKKLGERVLAAFAERFDIHDTSVPVTASCGIAWAPEQADTHEKLLRLADIALFRAKQRGRGRYRYFTEDMNASIRWRKDLEAELRRALTCSSTCNMCTSNGDWGLEVHYQPIVHVAGRRVVSFEALVRWFHEDRGEISPGTFVPLAEHCGLMPALGEWVMRRVFEDCAQFRGREVSINLSPLQLATHDFMTRLHALVEETGVDPHAIVFEITEGVLLENSDRVLGVLSEIRDMGFRIALDDFGTGFSSLAYLRLFQFDSLKIDRTFVQGIEADLDGQAILKTIVSLGRTLRMKVVAEGVETLFQQQLVEAAGCELVQGHLHSRAVPLAKALALLPKPPETVLRLAVG